MIDQEGRIPLDPDIQSQLGVKPGDQVIVENRGGKCVIKAADPEVGLCWEGNVLVHRGICAFPMDRFLAQDREDRMMGLSEGLDE